MEEPFRPEITGHTRTTYLESTTDPEPTATEGGLVRQSVTAELRLPARKVGWVWASHAGEGSGVGAVSRVGGSW